MTMTNPPPVQTTAESVSEISAKSTLILAGTTVVVHARWTYDKGAEECVGIFRATRDFSPVLEYRKYAEANPDAGPPESWDMKGRNTFLLWAIYAGKFLEDVTPYYLFLEPWPEKPAPDDAKVQFNLFDPSSPVRDNHTPPPPTGPITS